MLTVVLTPARRERKRHYFGNETVVLECRRRSDTDSHRVVQRRGPVLLSNLRQGAVDRNGDEILSIVEIFAVVQLDGVAINCVVEQVHLEKA